MTDDKRRTDARLRAFYGVSTQNLEDNVPFLQFAQWYNDVLRERDALRAQIEAIHSLLDGDESKIIRNAKDGYPEGREPKELTLTERVTALCKYASDWKRWFSEAESKIEQMERQKPVRHEFQGRDGAWRPFIDQRHYENTVVDGTWPVRALYALPGAKGE